MTKDNLKCPRCGVTVPTDRVKIIGRCLDACPLHDLVPGDYKPWWPEGILAEEFNAIPDGK